MKKTSLLLYLFIFISIIDLLFIISGHAELRWFSKPLLIPLLILYFWKTANITNLRYSTNIVSPSTLQILIAIALFFSFCGDTALLFSSKNSFLIGLVCFLIAHLLYIAIFSKILQVGKSYLSKNKYWLILFILFWLGINYILAPSLGDLQIPVLIYSSVIIIMVLSALNLKYSLNNQLFTTLFIGTILFMFSDMLLAITKFHTSIYGAGFMIMLTYLLAQFLIVKATLGILKSIRE